MTHSYAWHDSFIRATWLIQMRDMTYSHSIICVTCLIHMYGMTHSYVCHDSFICVTWLIHMCTMNHAYVRHDSFLCATWLIQMCDLNQTYTTRLISTLCDMNHLNFLFPCHYSKKPAKMAAKIDFCRGWDPRPCASVNHKQTGWGPHQRRWSDDARATLQRRPRHVLVWIRTDFLANRSVNGPAGGRPARWRGRRAGGNDSLHDVRARLKIGSQQLPWQGSCCTVAQARMHELWRYIYTSAYAYIYTYMYMYIYMRM